MLQPQTLADLTSRADTKQTAVILPEDGRSITYQSLAAQIDALAGRLLKALEPGQVVAIVLPNGPEYLVSFLGVTRARLVAAPLNPAYKADELNFYLEDSGARAVITSAEAVTVHQIAGLLVLPVWSARREEAGNV